MTLVKFNRPNRDLFPNFNQTYFGNALNEILDNSMLPLFSESSNPPVNIIEDENKLEIQLISPGHKKEDFDILLEDNLLTVSLDETKLEKVDNKNVKRQEYRFLTFKRTFNLPEFADVNSVHAEYLNGILLLRILKKQEVKPEIKKIQIS